MCGLSFLAAPEPGDEPLLGAVTVNEAEAPAELLPAGAVESAFAAIGFA